MRRLPDLAALIVFDERLRQIPTDRAAIERAAAAARDALKRVSADADDQGKLRLLGYLGTAERVLGNHASAVARLQESVEVAARVGDRRSQAVARIRLGEAYRCADRLEEAEAVLRQALAETQGRPHHDFALQHLGKCLTDQGRFDEALAHLGEALQLRRSKGDPELVASTEAALERALRMRAAAPPTHPPPSEGRGKG